MTIFRDLRFGFRLLTRNPSFGVAAIAVLALGIGATTAVFSVVRGVLLQPLPYRDVDRIVTFRADAPGFDHAPALTTEEFFALRARTDIFDEAATANESPASITGVADMERVTSASISDNFLPLFGVAPAIGRQVDSRQDIGPTWVQAVDISYELWQRRWHGDPSVVGRGIEVNNLKMTIAGVMPRGFRLYLGDGTGIAPRVDVWYPGAPDHDTTRGHPVVARLRPGVTLASAQSAVDAFMKQFIADHPASYRTGAVRLTLAPLAADVVRTVKPALLAFGAAVGFVLLVACANLANLLLARAYSRTRELAVRTAVGASRTQLVQQLAIESLVIAAVGAAVGILVAQWARDGLLALAPASLPRRENIVIDGAVLAFAAGAALCSSLLFGLLPAWQATRADLVAMMKQGAGSSARGARTRGFLVASQLALSLMLLVGAGLMGRSFLRLRDVPLGFNPANVVTIQVDLPGRLFTPQKTEAFYASALEAARRVPGVEAAALGRPVPLDGERLTRRYSLGPGGPEGVASAIVAFGGYAEFLGVPLRAGRYFTAADAALAVVMIDERMAAVVWPGQYPIGKRILLSPGLKSEQWAEVVGVVGHAQFEDLRHTATPQLWVHHRLMPYAVDIAFRTHRDRRAVAAAVKTAVEALGPGRPLFGVRALEDYVADAAADTRFALSVLGVFAALAVLLVAVGVYGVVAYATARRTREIAVRLALGADARRIVALVLREGAAWTAGGLVAGAVGARLLTHYVQTLLFGVPPNDPLTFIGVASLLAVVALVATAVPAVRALRIDPMQALRAE
jgi:putative ABC transport system permease protein